MKCFLFVSIVLLVSIAQAKPNQFLSWPRLDGRIVGGHIITIKDAPHQVSLQRGSHFCGGSIIGDQWILTAAHCTDGQRPELIQVRIGSTSHLNGGVLVPVAEIVQHANFSMQRIDYDYSLLRLNVSLNLDENKRAIRLPEQNETIEDKSQCKVTGWGNTQNITESRNVLREADVPIVNQIECSKAYKEYGGITARMLCAGLREGGRDACQGDSGGPLKCNDKLFGIVSWGFGCAKPRFPGIYSRVPAVREWIREQTGI